jgi:ATP-dependent helicase/nuclease subunit B
MPLHVITGRANAGKTGRAYALFREALRDGSDPVLLLPGSPDVDRASAELAREFPLGVKAMTFRGFVEAVWLSDGDGRAIVSAAQRRALLYAAAADDETATSGLVGLAEQCVARLCEQTGFAWRLETPSVDGPGAPLARLIRGYAQRLAASSLVELDEVASVLPLEGGAEWPPVIVHRFGDLGVGQEALFLRAAAAGVRIAITLNWEKDFTGTEALSPLLERLLAAGATAEVVISEDTYGTAEELVSLEQNLLVADARVVATGRVRRSMAEGYEAEAVRIAEEVRRLAVAENVIPEHIAVLFREPQRHEAVLRRAFAEAGIEADFDLETPFGSTGYGAALLALVRFAAKGERRDVLAYLKTRFSGADPDTVAALEAGWRRGRVVDPAQLVRAVEKEDRQCAATISDARGLARSPINASSAPKWLRMMHRMFAAGYGRSGIELGPGAEADAWAYSAAAEVLADLAQLSDSGVTAPELMEVLAERAVTPRNVERPGRVQVGSVTRMRARRFTAVILGGLTSDEFPSAQSESLVPGSAAARVLAEFGGEAQGRTGAAYERLLMYQTLTRAKSHLVLSTCTADSDGEPMQVSPLLAEVLDLYRDGDKVLLQSEHRSLAHIPHESADAGNSREALRALALNGEGTHERVAAAKRRASGRRPGLSLDRLLAVTAEREVFSASEIEAYLACPYGWFYTRVLRPEQLDREPGAADQGLFAHELLERFYTQRLETARPRVTVEQRKDAIADLRAVFEERSALEPDRPVEERIAHREALRWAERIVSDDAEMFDGFEPLRLEWDFVSESVDMGGYRLSGRVDRVDTDGQGHALVMDYKRSSGATAAQMISQGKVQLPLYLRAVEIGLGLRPVGGIYRVLRKPENRGLARRDLVSREGLVSTDLLDEQAFEATMAGALGLAAEAVAGMRAGAIECAPLATASCSYCAAAPVCGKARR